MDLEEDPTKNVARYAVQPSRVRTEAITRVRGMQVRMARHLQLAIVVGLALALLVVLVEPSLFALHGRPVLKQQSAKLLHGLLALLTVSVTVLLFTNRPALPLTDTSAVYDVDAQARICTMRC
jgi:hypothetical protein